MKYASVAAATAAIVIVAINKLSPDSVSLLIGLVVLSVVGIIAALIALAWKEANKEDVQQSATQYLAPLPEPQRQAQPIIIVLPSGETRTIFEPWHGEAWPEERQFRVDWNCNDRPKNLEVRS